MSNTQVNTFFNGRRVFERQCKFCNHEITLTWERIADDRHGNMRHRYVPRSAISHKIHNCVMQPNLENIRGRGRDTEMKQILKGLAQVLNKQIADRGLIHVANKILMQEYKIPELYTICIKLTCLKLGARKY